MAIMLALEPLRRGFKLGGVASLTDFLRPVIDPLRPAKSPNQEPTRHNRSAVTCGLGFNKEFGLGVIVE